MLVVVVVVVTAVVADDAADKSSGSAAVAAFLAEQVSRTWCQVLEPEGGWVDRVVQGCSNAEGNGLWDR